MRRLPQHPQFAKIFVEGDKHVTFLVGSREDGSVAWVLIPIGGTDHVVAG